VPFSAPVVCKGSLHDALLLNPSPKPARRVCRNCIRNTSVGRKKAGVARSVLKSLVLEKTYHKSALGFQSREQYAYISFKMVSHVASTVPVGWDRRSLSSPHRATESWSVVDDIFVRITQETRIDTRCWSPPSRGRILIYASFIYKGASLVGP